MVMNVHERLAFGLHDTVSTWKMKLVAHAKFRREFVLVATGQVASFAGGIVTVKLLTRALAPAQYGLLALSLTAVMLSLQVAFSPSLGAAARFYAVAVQSGQVPSFVRGLATFCLGAISLVVALLAIAIPWVRQHKAAYAPLLLPLSGLIILTALNSVASSVQSAARQRGVVGIHDASGQWLRGILAWISVSLFSTTAAFALWGQLAASAVVLLSQAVLLARLFRKHLSLPMLRPPSADPITTVSMWRFAWPYTVWGGFFWFGVASERWALGAFRGMGSVGIYQAAYQLGYSPLALCVSAVQAFVSPIVFEKVGSGSDAVKLREAHRLILTLTWWTLGGTLLLAAGSILIGPVIYGLLTSAAYAGGVKLVPLALLSAGVFSAGQFMSLDYLNARKSGLLIYPKAISSGLAAVFAWAGAKWAGPLGVFVGSVAANTLYLFLIWLLCPGRKAKCSQQTAQVPALIEH
jgi:O-antigen/teichoic acid export membrane protein